MGIKIKIFNLTVSAKELIGFIRNWFQFKIWKVKYDTFPIIRGKIFLNNFGTIVIEKNVYINSNLESSQLGYYPKTVFHTSQSGTITIGENTGLSNVCLYSRECIRIGKNVRLGAGVKIYDNDFHNVYDILNDDNPNKIPTKPVIIENNVFIGAGSMILKGVHIGKGVIIGTGSVVTRNIPQNEVWAGNPAKFIRKVN